MRSILYDPRPQDELCWAVMCQHAWANGETPVFKVESRHASLRLAEGFVQAADARPGAAVH